MRLIVKANSSFSALPPLPIKKVARKNQFTTLMWQGWINTILGIIMLVMTYTTTSTTWFAIVSILIIIFSI